VQHALAAAVRLSSLAASLSYGWSLALIDSALDGALDVASHDGAGPEVDTAMGWALEARGTTLRFLGRTRESMEALERARALGETRDVTLLARALTGLGNGSTVLARWSDARRYFEGALAIYQEHPDRLTEGRVRTMLAASFYSEDQLEAAAEHLERALEIQREEADRSFEGMSVASMGVVDIARGRRSAARAALDEALAIHRETGDRHWEAVTLGYLGTLALDATGDGEDLDAAVALLSEARAILSELGVRRAEAIVVGQLGHAAMLRGAYDEALIHYRASLTWHRQTSPDYEGVVLATIAAIAALRGDVAAAKPGFERAARVLAPFPRPSFHSAVALYTALVDVALARKAIATSARDEDEDEADGHERRARATLETTLSGGEMRSTESRFAARLLAHALATLESERTSSLAAKDPRSLVVDPTGLWFRPPGSDTVVRLHRRRALSTMLRALVERRAARPGEALPVPSLLESGWPGERVLPEAGQVRVYTAIATLRRMGLRDVLIRRDDGYLLSPDVVVVRSSAGTTEAGTHRDR
jgi:tetratricopeptide (TPR) repeat protein